MKETFTSDEKNIIGAVAFTFGLIFVWPAIVWFIIKF